ncbi:MAG TPA: acyl-CoA thioesterase [Phycisphaerales bacterium]|nr:acyl-CoA thioesterase [Phycisphaerales bacterium]
MYKFQTKICMHQTDAGGVVFFSNYFVLAHLCYEAWLDENISIADIIAEKNLLMPIVHAGADYRQSLCLSEDISIEMTPGKTTRTTFQLDYSIFNADGDIAAEITTIHACLDETKRKSTRLPEFLKEMLTVLDAE